MNPIANRADMSHFRILSGFPCRFRFDVDSGNPGSSEKCCCDTENAGAATGVEHIFPFDINSFKMLQAQNSGLVMACTEGLSGVDSDDMALSNRERFP